MPAAAEPAAAAAAAAAAAEEEQEEVDNELLAKAHDGDEEGVRDALARGAQPNGAKDVR